jgi:ABC-type amino acid transport substrate-binding protein
MPATDVMRSSIAALTLVVCALVPVTTSAQTADFLFYSPEFGPGNLGLLTQAAENYFTKSGLSLEFQPFARYEDFRNEVAKRHPPFVIAPHWIEHGEALGIRLTPLVEPIRGGERFDCKALMAGPTIQRAADMENGSVAATLPSPPRQQVYPALRKLRIEHPGVRVIPVPKDVDALLAVGFGQVDAAFVSIAQLEMLRRVNPNLTRQLHEIGYTEQIPYPRIYATEYASAEQSQRLVAAMLGATATPEGRRLTSILGYDRWQAAGDGTNAPAAVNESCGQSGVATP